MAQTVNVHEAKTHLSRLLEAVEHGEDVVIARSGRPVARLVPVVARSSRTPGAWKGRVVVAADFDDTPAEVLQTFHGSDEGGPL